MANKRRTFAQLIIGVSGVTYMINQTESKKVRYEMRNEIENIIKEYGIDRTKFYEVAKNHYQEVIHKLYYSFCDYQKYPAIQLAYMWTRFRKELNRTDSIRTNWRDWKNYISSIDDLVPERNLMAYYYLIVDGGWIYEGRLDEIKKVLFEYPISMDDFYLFPKDYSWLINHCDDGACMYRVWK